MPGVFNASLAMRENLYVYTIYIFDTTEIVRNMSFGKSATWW